MSLALKLFWRKIFPASLTEQTPEKAPPIQLKARLAVFALRLLALLPLRLIPIFGFLIGHLLWLVPNKQRRVAAINLKLCFPELSARQRQMLLRRNLIETSQTFLELGSIWLHSAQRVLQRIRHVEGEQHWQAALAKGRGAIILTPHLGAWEMTNVYISKHYPLTGMFRPSRQGPELDALIHQARQRLGAQLVPADTRGVKVLLQKLRAGEVVGMLPDQNPAAGGGVFAPFFGQPAYTMVLLSRLAQKCQVPVFLLYAERLSWGRGYRLCFQGLPDSVATASLEQSVAVLNTAIEQSVRRIPAQYLWVYKRFKKRPPGLPKLY